MKSRMSEGMSDIADVLKDLVKREVDLVKWVETDLVCKTKPVYTRETYNTARVYYQGMYLDDEFTRDDMRAICHDAIELSKIFWEQDKQLLKSMEETPK